MTALKNNNQFKQLRQLWEIRFLKMLDLEKDSLYFYSALLRKHKKFLDGTLAKPVLEQIMKDEAKHMQVVSELLRMVRAKNGK